MKFLVRTYYFISSMKVGLILLGLIGLLAAVGSGIFPDAFYSNIVFKLLFVLFMLNMACCTINQLWKYFKNRPRQVHPQRILRQTGIWLLHAGVVLILIGGMMNYFYGQTKQIRLMAGEEIDLSSVLNNTESFLLKLEKFEIEYNPDGSPSQYYSHVTWQEKRNAAGNYTISVNYPLKYRGVKVYQKSFGYRVKAASLSQRGQLQDRILEEGDILALSSDTAVKFYKYIPNFDPAYGMTSKSLRPDNPRIVYSLYQNGTLANVGVTALGEKLAAEGEQYLLFEEIIPLTVLEVKKDPGLPAALSGGIMLMAGTCLSLITKKKKQRSVP